MAVQSHFFGVGSIVSWAEAGVGAVATQSMVEPAYGPRGLDLHARRRERARRRSSSCSSDDEQEAVRQVAMVDRGGTGGGAHRARAASRTRATASATR